MSARRQSIQKKRGGPDTRSRPEGSDWAGGLPEAGYPRSSAAGSSVTTAPDHVVAPASVVAVPPKPTSPTAAPSPEVVEVTASGSMAVAK